MKKNFNNYFLFYIKLRVIRSLFLLICISTTSLIAQNLPDRSVILGKMLLANEYFMNKWPDPTIDIVTDKRRPSNIWTRATYYEGLMALYRIDPDEKFYNYAVQWAESHNWEPAYGGTTTRNADNQACGQTYIELYQIDPKPERIEKIKSVIDNMINSPEINDWWWIDALHMAMPVFAKLGTIYNDTTYFNRMYEMYMHTKTVEGDSGLYNKIDHLWWRDKNFDPPHKSPNGEDTYWSRGNGWVFAALARVLDVLPENAPHRDEYIETFIEMAEAIISVQREDGFWNVSLHDPSEYGGKESSGTALFTFGLAWGINKGLLSAPTYKQSAIKGWIALSEDALHENGFLGYVQSTGKQPSDGQPVTYDKAPNFEDYGLGAFLLAGSEIYKMAGDITDISSYTSNVPAEAVVYPAYPNPFNPQTTISFSLPEISDVRIELYDLQGQLIETFLNKTLNAGFHKINYQGKYLSNGVYLLKIIIRYKKANKVFMEKLVYMK
ncbi:glycoside hydrolase family 88 protein [Melioribacter sp. OK-6-Me]|uniref:glycoside hydrolase family 88 protein n=1 Tax=unclassified Melioribacter TaxID=2627329 RepID=UPI003EDADDE6